jgi:hypothetical protein
MRRRFARCRATLARRRRLDERPRHRPLRIAWNDGTRPRAKRSRLTHDLAALRANERAPDQHGIVARRVDDRETELLERVVLVLDRHLHSDVLSHEETSRPGRDFIEMSTCDSSLATNSATRDDYFFLRIEVIRSAFFRLTDWIALRSFEIEHGLFDAIPGANLSPTFLSRDLPLFRECTPARREAQRIIAEPTYVNRRG